MNTRQNHIIQRMHASNVGAHLAGHTQNPNYDAFVGTIRAQQ